MGKYDFLYMVSAGTNGAMLTSRKPWTCPIKMLFSLWTAIGWKLSSASLCFDGVIMTACGQGTKQLVAGLQWILNDGLGLALPVEDVDFASCGRLHRMILYADDSTHCSAFCHAWFHTQSLQLLGTQAALTHWINWIRMDKTMWM